MKTGTKGHIAIITANIIYGINYVVAKEVMPKYIEPVGFIGLRIIGAAILFWIVSLWFPQRIEKKDVLLFILCGVFGVALNQLMFFMGLNVTTPINASIIMICTPILVLVSTFIVLKESMELKRIIGIALGISGALWLILIAGDAKFGNDTSKGDFMILINAISFTVYLVLAKPLFKKYSVITISKWIFLVGTIIVFPFSLSDLNQVHWSVFSSLIWVDVIYVVVAVTFFAYLLNNYGLKVLSPNIVSIYIYSQPLLAALIAVNLDKDAIDANKIIAALLIFTGVYLSSSTKTHKVKV